MVKKKTTPAKKATTKKAAARPAKKAAKKAVKKAAKKTPAKKAAAKKTAAAASAPKKTATRKTTASKKPAAKDSGKATKAPAKKPAKTVVPSTNLKKKLAARSRGKSRQVRAGAFTLDDVRGEIDRSRALREEEERKVAEIAKRKAEDEAAKKKLLEAPPEHRSYDAASLSDILGFNPVSDEKPDDEEATIPKKFKPYYKLLIELRDHVKSGLDLHTEETLKRSNRDDSGDLSGYGQHMADAGTDNFDRDFALSLVSNEQEALYEIEEAIQRIKNGTYGICELTGEPIDKERLLAVPFARYSVASQAQVEKGKRRTEQRGGAFGDIGDDGPKIISDDDNE